MEKRVINLLIGVFGCSLLLAACMGEPATAHAAGAASIGGLKETQSLTLSLLRVGGALVVVLLLLYATVYLLKRSGLGQGGGGASQIEVLESKAIGPKRYISIVRVAGKTLTLGVTEHNITMLRELTKEEAELLTAEPLAASAAGENAKKFRQVLRRSLRRRASGGKA